MFFYLLLILKNTCIILCFYQNSDNISSGFIFSPHLLIDGYKQLLGPKVILNEEAVYQSNEIKSGIFSM